MKSSGGMRRKQIEARAAELIMEEMALHELGYVKRSQSRESQD
jgi:hypothetical protein